MMKMIARENRAQSRREKAIIYPTFAADMG